MLIYKFHSNQHIIKLVKYKQDKNKLLCNSMNMKMSIHERSNLRFLFKSKKKKKKKL